MNSIRTFVSCNILRQEFTGGTEGQHSTSLWSEIHGVCELVLWRSVAWPSLHAWSTVCQTTCNLMVHDRWCCSHKEQLWTRMESNVSLVHSQWRRSYFPITMLILHLPDAKPQPQCYKDTCDLLFTNHDLLVNIIFFTAAKLMKRHIHQTTIHTSFSKSITSIVTYTMWTYYYTNTMPTVSAQKI
jgi:hypothetical protein